MNEELTNEVLEAVVNCDDRKDCIYCPAQSVCEDRISGIKQSLATALLEEMVKPKVDVWKGAPEWATSAEVTWESAAEGKRRTGPTYTRELPKSRARQIAEEEGHGLAEKYGWNAAAKELVTNVMESALNKYAEELEGKE